MLNEFFASIYETFHYSNEFSGDIYNENLYQTLGVVLILTSLFFPVLYYKLIDKVRYANKIYWLLFVILTTVIINFLIAYLYPNNLLVGLGIEYDSNEYFSLAIVNAGLAVLLTFIFSLVIKNFSTNCKKIPF